MMLSMLFNKVISFKVFNNDAIIEAAACDTAWPIGHLILSLWLDEVFHGLLFDFPNVKRGFAMILSKLNNIVISLKSFQLRHHH